MKYGRTGVVFFAVAMVAACSGSKGSGFGGGGGGGDGSGDGGSPGQFGTGGDGGAGSEPCVPGPGNYDFPGNNCDDDGDGTVDNPATCDTGLDVAGNASAFVQALGICQMADADHWGLVSADFTNGFGKAPGSQNDNQHGILPKFGSVITPREGASLGVLSTGYGREYDNGSGSSSSGSFKADYAGFSEGGAVPSGFPKPGTNAAGTACPIDSSVNNVIDLKLQLKVPANAKGIAFDFDFWSGEWPDFVCSKFNDGFIAYLTSSAFNGGAPDNISFDSKNNPVSVNNGFFDRCTAGFELGCDSCGKLSGCSSQGTSECPGGEGELAGTGFEGPKDTYAVNCSDHSTTKSVAGGATGWLTTQAPVAPNETITLEFMIWNTGDNQLDSSVLLDHLTWVQGETVTGTNRPR